MNFPFSRALAVSHKFWCVLFSFSFHLYFLKEFCFKTHLKLFRFSDLSFFFIDEDIKTQRYIVQHREYSQYSIIMINGV